MITLNQSALTPPKAIFHWVDDAEPPSFSRGSEDVIVVYQIPPVPLNKEVSGWKRPPPGQQEFTVPLFQYSYPNDFGAAMTTLWRVATFINNDYPTHNLLLHVVQGFPNRVGFFISYPLSEETHPSKYDRDLGI